jgi:hypothetical protein
MNGILAFLVVGLTVVLAKMAPAQVVTIDPNNYGNGQVITAPGVTLQTETFTPAGTTDGVALYSPVFGPVYSNTIVGCGPICPPVGTNLFAPSPTGASPNGGGYNPGGFWGGSAIECAQNCLFNSLYSSTVYLEVNFTTPTDFVNTLAFSTGGDPTVITAFDSAGNVLGSAIADLNGSSDANWSYASVTTATDDISRVLIGGAAGTWQGVNEISYAPEIDSTSAASGLTLLLGSLLVLRGRRPKPSSSPVAV